MPATAKSNVDPLADFIATFYDNPLGFVRAVFPWGEEGPLEDESLDDWQIDILTTLGDEIKNRDSNEAIQTAIQIAVASGHGIGKTALISWIIIWFASTRPHPQIVCTANTEPQLRNKTWRELSKWHKLAIHSHWFEWSATRFHLKQHPQTWFAAAIPWTEHRSEAFAGTHEKHVLVLYDEASTIARIIWEVTEGAMTTPGAIWIAFGNPTQNTGRFRECFGKLRHRWITRQIDSRTAKMANEAQIDQWIEDYGEDSDFVRVRVKGEFPRASSTQFIATDIVTACQRDDVDVTGYSKFPVVFGVDVARFGDDQSVICVRQGRKMLKQYKFRGLDTMALAAQVVEKSTEHKPAAIFIDGVGVGGGVVDRCKQLGLKVFDVNAGAAATDKDAYKNKRAEMWGGMRDWLQSGASIIADSELESDLIGIEYGYTPLQQIILEKKEDMKKRGLASPDCADALALTFAMPVAMPSAPRPVRQGNNKWVV